MESPRGEHETAVRSRTREVPLGTRSDAEIRAFLEGETPRVVWRSPGGLEIGAVGAVATITATGEERFERIRKAGRELLSAVDHEGPAVSRPRLIGGFAFGEGTPASPWTAFSNASFVLPEAWLTREPDRPGTDGATRTWLTVAATDASAESIERELDTRMAALSSEGEPKTSAGTGMPSIVATEARPGEGAWTEAVERATERLEHGELQKVVLANALDVELDGPIDALDALDALGDRYPECFRVLFAPTPAASFLSATPERLVSLRDGHAESEALAGSIERGETPREDEALAEQLRGNDKLRREQGLVLAAIRERLGALGSVTIGSREIRRLSNIQHLRTPISADIEDEHVLSIVKALHPTPAVGGLPPDRAGETIAESEPFDRGWYAGPVGWFDRKGDGEFAVGIRSAVLGDRHARLFAGNGILADSDPETEWAELRAKYEPILEALGDG